MQRPLVSDNSILGKRRIKQLSLIVDWKPELLFSPISLKIFSFTLRTLQYTTYCPGTNRFAELQVRLFFHDPSSMRDACHIRKPGWTPTFFLSHARKTENLLKQMGLTMLYALLYSFVIYKLRKKIVYTLNLAIFEANAAPTFWSSPSLLRRQLMVTASSGVERWSFNMAEWPVWWPTAQQNYNTKETKNSTTATNLILI